MKLYLLIKILIIAGCLIFLIGCQATEEQEKPMFKFATVSQSEWNSMGKNFYLLSFSMRKIDSLSADLNLNFTRRNAQGL
jgi:hypothetical protein